MICLWYYFQNEYVVFDILKLPEDEIKKKIKGPRKTMYVRTLGTHPGVAAFQSSLTFISLRDIKYNVCCYLFFV